MHAFIWRGDLTGETVSHSRRVRNRKMQHTCGCWVFERQALHPLGRVIIVNERFETTDNAYSLELALDSIRDVRGEVLVLDSDLAYDAESVEALLAAKGGSFLVSSESTDPSGTGVLVNGQGEVVAVGKHLVHTGLRYACAMKLTEKNRVDLLDILKRETSKRIGTLFR